MVIIIRWLSIIWLSPLGDYFHNVVISIMWLSPLCGHLHNVVISVMVISIIMVNECISVATGFIKGGVIFYLINDYGNGMKGVFTGALF